MAQESDEIEYEPWRKGLTRLTPAELEVYEGGETLLRTANRAQLNIKTVIAALRRQQARYRDQATAQRHRRTEEWRRRFGRPDLLTDGMIERYHDGTSARQLAIELGVHHQVVTLELRRRGVAVRSRAEAFRRSLPARWGHAVDIPEGSTEPASLAIRRLVLIGLASEQRRIQAEADQCNV